MIGFYTGLLGFELKKNFGSAFAIEAGANFCNEIISGPGGQQILVEDPSGNAIEFCQPA